MVTYYHRSVRVVEGNEDKIRVRFSNFLEVPYIILLGDPGSGKTFTFQAASKAENAIFYTVRKFLTLDESDISKFNGPIYLDALDEYRPRTQDKNLVLDIIKQLKKMGRPKLRLSCRSADWLGQTDLSLFKDYFEDEEYVVLMLEPLTRLEQEHIIKTKGIENPKEFIEKAEKHGVASMLENPQTLIMLINVVHQTHWPETKKELFEKAIQILLSEHDENRVHDGLGQFTWDELIDPAGAVCASLLISGSSGVSLTSKHSVAFPSYRSVPFNDKKKVLAALLSKAFQSSPDQSNAVIPEHRTIAEFLAARWLREKLSNGFSILRLQNLITFEGMPAPELRGLSAWLSTLHPEYFYISVKKDPFGILIYGDPANLTKNQRLALLNNLEIYSKTDPWFRKDWSEKQLGALSGPEMIESFKNILQNPEAGFHLKSIVLDAIAHGPPLESLGEILISIIREPTNQIEERIMAVDAFLNVAESRKEELIKIFEEISKKEKELFRLRIKIVDKLYSTLGKEAVCNILYDFSLSDKEESFGFLYTLEGIVPIEELPFVLNFLLSTLKKPLSPNLRNFIDLEYFYLRVLQRILESTLEKQPSEIWKWLYGFYKIFRSTPSKNVYIAKWLKKNKNIALEMFKIGFNELDDDEQGFLFFSDYQKIMMDSVGIKDLILFILNILKTLQIFSKKHLFLYEFSLLKILNSEFAQELLKNGIFSELYNLAEKFSQLKEVRKKATRCELGGWEQQFSIEELERKRKAKEQRKSQIAMLSKELDSIASGWNKDYLGFLALFYYGFFNSVDKNLNPYERLRQTLNDEIAIAVIRGFKAMLLSEQLPSPKEILKLYRKKGYYNWWHAILAGMDEHWLETGDVTKLPYSILTSVFTLALGTSNNYDSSEKTPRKEWMAQLFQKRLDIVEGVFREVAELEVKAEVPWIDIFHYLAKKPETRSIRTRLAIEFLEQYPHVYHRNLRHLLTAALYDPNIKEKIEDIAFKRIFKRGQVRKEQRALWLTVAYLLNEKKFEHLWINYFKKRKWAIWELRDLLTDLHIGRDDPLISLSARQLQVFISISAKHFPNIDFPSESTGNRNVWDGAEFVRQLINILASIPSAEAGELLKQLSEMESTRSYKNLLKHTHAEQFMKRMDHFFIQPDWDETVRVFNEGKPANMGDLFCLLIERLNTIKTEIKQSNTDKYKAFWRCNSHGRVESPEIEDICRDRLIDLLRPYLTPLEIRVEPEGHMARDKRADIVCYYGTSDKIVLETKRDTHRDLWTACINQLERQYAHDPEAQGYGIYVVFWFGEKQKGKICKAPEGIDTPKSPDQLEDALNKLIPYGRRYRLKAVVIDVTPD